MEASRVCGNRDNPRLPVLGLGLSSVRLIVNKIESEYARASQRRELLNYPSSDEGYEDEDDSPLSSERGRVLNRIFTNIGYALSKCVPSVSFANFSVVAVILGIIAPTMFSYLVIYPFCRLVFGTLYPAYASYKAVRTKNLKEYVKWMMYWIVFALFTCTETFTDVFLSWFPFYYEVKIVLVLWLLSPATKGSSILYRKFVHPALCRREQEIDEYIAKAKDQGYHTVLNLGTKGVNYATTVIMQTAIKGGGGLVQQLRKSYSLSDLTECTPLEERAAIEATDVLAEPCLVRRSTNTGYGTKRSASESNSRSPMYFPEVDVDLRSSRGARGDQPDFSHIKSSEDISSGYSSADNSGSLTRVGSLNAARAKTRTTRTTVTTIKRPQAAEENEVIIEELHDDDTFDYANMPPLVNLPSTPVYLSNSEPPFLYQYVGDQIRILQVLGEHPLNTNFNIRPNNTDQRDQTEPATKQNVLTSDNVKEKSTVVPSDGATQKEKHAIEAVNEEPVRKQDTEEEFFTSLDVSQINIEEKNNNTVEFEQKDNNLERTDENIETKTDTKAKLENEEEIDKKSYIKTTESPDSLKESDISDDRRDCTSLDTSPNDNDSTDSDDEASFGTPDNSPRSKRKSPKGKYGKGKAPPPPPPKTETPSETTIIQTSESLLDAISAISTTSQESLVEIVHKLPTANLKETSTSKSLHVINPIAEKKRRHKSKSPARIPKGNSSGLGKLLQIPGKLAFWNKSDDKSKDNNSTSSGDQSRRSSTIEKSADEFQISTHISLSQNVEFDISQPEIDDTFDDQISFKDASDFESEAITHDIIEKSNELKKLIEEKLVSHPEYKFVSLHEHIPTAGKSTDV